MLVNEALMSGVFSDQAFVDLLIERIQDRFRFVPAWGIWFERVEGYWRPKNAEARLRDEYRTTVEMDEGEGLTLTARRKAINASSQREALWLLREDERLRAEPEEIAPWLKRPGSDSPHARVRESALFEIEGHLPPDSLSEFFAHAYARMGRIANILIRTDHNAPELSRLYPAARELFGETCIRLSWNYWQAPPDFLTPAAALLLAGARLVFLDGLENAWTGKRFPQEHLFTLAASDTLSWRGEDRYWHDLSPPTHFIIPGPPLEMQHMEYYLRPHFLPLSSLEKQR